RYLEGNFNQGLLHLQPDIDETLTTYVETERKRLSLELQDLPEGTDEPTINAKMLRRVSEAIIKLSNLRQRLGLIYAAATDDTADERAVSEDEINLLGKILSQAKTTVNEWDGTLYFVYLPERERYVDRQIANKDDKNREQVLKIARSVNLP